MSEKPRFVDVNKAREAIQRLGYIVGYLQTATFFVAEPDTVETPRYVVVGVHELERLGESPDVEALKRGLSEIALTPIDRAYPRNQA